MRYRAFAFSVRGGNHVLRNTPCQDSYTVDSSNDHLTLVAADGHGGVQYERSDIGSRLACTVFASMIRVEVEDHAAAVRRNEVARNSPLFSAQGATNFKKAFIEQWYANILEDAANRDGEDIDSNLDLEDTYSTYKHLIKKYGTTLLACVFYSEHVFFFQIGDGQIVVHADGSLDLAFSDNKTSNVTSSLCNAGAETLIQFKSIKNISPSLVLAVYLVTDGVSDVFEEETKNKLRLYTTSVTNKQEKQLIPVVAHMAKFVTHCAFSSGDDSTLVTAIITIQ